MPSRNYPPPYLRYLSARLQNLRRPSFWATVFFLFVVGLVTWKYGFNHDLSVYNQNRESARVNSTESSLSDEERAIAADIDNLPVIFNDFEQGSASVIASESGAKTQKKPTQEIFNDVESRNIIPEYAKSKPNLGLVKNNTSFNANSPFVAQAEILLQSRRIDSGFLGINSVDALANEETKDSSGLEVELTNRTQKNQTPALINPLQAALNQSTYQKQPSSNPAFSNQTNSLGQLPQTDTTQSLTTNSLNSQTVVPSNEMSYTQPKVINQPPNVDINYSSGQTAPNIGTSTIVVSPVTSTLSNGAMPYPPVVTPSQNGVTQTNSTGYGNYDNNGNSSQQQSTQSNFSYRRQTQSRYLRGTQNNP